MYVVWVTVADRDDDIYLMGNLTKTAANRLVTVVDQIFNPVRVWKEEGP